MHEIVLHVPLADKYIVVRSFVHRNYDKVGMDSEKFSDKLRKVRHRKWTRV